MSNDNKFSEVHKTIKDLVPLVNPNDLEITGWDISDFNMYESCLRARVLEPHLIEQLKPELEKLKPMKSAFVPDFVASNQADRVNNVFEGSNRFIINQIRNDIAEFKKKVESVVVLWTANTEETLKTI